MLLLSENRESIESEDKFARDSIETHIIIRGILILQEVF